MICQAYKHHLTDAMITGYVRTGVWLELTTKCAVATRAITD